MLLTLKSTQSNAVSVINSLIKELRVPVSSFTVKNDLENHPDYPTLLALSDCLNNWKIPNNAFRVDKGNFKTGDLAYPFIAHLYDEGGRFILVHEAKDANIKYTDEKGLNQILTEEEFLRKWDGVVLYAEKEEGSGESNYRTALTKGWMDKLRIPFLLSVVLLGVFTTISFTELSIPYLAVLVIKLFGIAISVLLIMQSIDTGNPFIKNLCSLGKKNDCNTILKSDAANLTSWLSWTEVGLFYFVGSFTCLLFNPGSVSLLIWLSLACLPYTFYSIWYQFKIKNWCVLCCSIQVLLWTEALVLIFSYPVASVNFEISQWILTVLCFLWPIALWAVIKPLLLRSAQSKPLQQQLRKFKYNSDLFNQLLTNQPHYNVSSELMPIRLGNQNAETMITMISNPFCGPCATTHKFLENWLEMSEDIQLQIVFATANEDTELRTKVARHIAALGRLEDSEIVKEAMNNWYGQGSKNYEMWAEKYPIVLDSEISKVTERQKKWCIESDIQFTPTILINGYKLVEPYQLEDLKYLLA